MYSGLIYRIIGLKKLGLHIILISNQNTYLMNYFFSLIISFRYWSIAMALLVVTLLIGIVLGNCLVNSLSVPPLDSMKLIHGEK
jgi:hypothetical protein